MFQIVRTFSQYDKKIFASIYKNEFMRMLEKVSARRITLTKEEEKVEADLRLFNELTAMAKYGLNGILRR